MLLAVAVGDKYELCMFHQASPVMLWTPHWEDPDSSTFPKAKNSFESEISV